MLVYPMPFIITNMNCLELILVVSIPIIIIVGSIWQYRNQTCSLQIKLEKARHENERENSRNRIIAEYRAKILDCIKSTKEGDYADKEQYIKKIEEFLETI